MKSIRCLLINANRCEHFIKSGECISPVKCKFQMEFVPAKFPETIFMPTKEAWEKMQAENSRLTAENAELRATLFKLETVEKELTDRLKKAAELPYMYEAELVDSAGHFLKTIYIVLYNNNGTIRAIQYSYKKVADARLKELQGGEK